MIQPRRIIASQTLVLCHLLAFALIGSTSGAALEKRAPLPTIDSVARFYGLTGDEIRQGYPVRIEGVVVYSDANWRLFWLRGDSGTLFQQIPKGLKLPPAKTRAVVTGRTALIDGAHRIANLEVTGTGPGELPPPMILVPKILNKGLSLHERVRFGGTVAHVERLDTERARLVITFMRSHQILVTLRHVADEELEKLLGAQIELSGHPSPMAIEPPPGVSPIQIFVPDMSDVTVYRRGPRNPFETPTIALNQLELEYRRMPEPRIVVLRGKVTRQLDPSRIELTSGTNKATVRLSSPLELKTNSMVEASGIAWRDSQKQPYLSQARVRSAGIRKTSPPRPANSLPILHTIQAVRGLTPEQAERRYPVDVRGTVTYYDRAWRVLFIQDATGGIYIDEKRRPLQLKPGDRIRVRGVSDPGGYAPMISARNIDVENADSNTSDLPAPRTVAFGRLLSGAEDSQWIKLAGRVQKASRSQRNLQLRVLHQGGEFDVVLMGLGKSLKTNKWIGAEIELTGVCGTRANVHRQATGILLHVPNLQHVKFLNVPPENPFNIPTTPLAKLLRFDAQEGEYPQPVKIAGQVTFVGTTGLASVQDNTRGTLIQFSTNSMPTIGHRIEVLGLPSAAGFSPTLTLSAWRPLGQAAPPEPVPLEAHAALLGTQEAQLVVTEATVIQSHLDSAIPSLTLRDRGTVFSADLSALAGNPQWAELLPETVVRVIGVCSTQADEWNQPRSFRLLVPSNVPLEIIRRPPWLGTQQALAVAGGLGVAVLIALGWIMTLRLRVAKQTRKIRRQLEEKSQLSARYNELFENAGDLVFTLDRSGRFETVNPAAADTFGTRQATLIHTAIFDRLTAESADSLRTALTRLSTNRPTASVELIMPDDKILEASVRLRSHDQSPDEIQCIARNVSERRGLEAQILQMQKMESVGQLAAGVAHDYNNLMTIILGNSEFIMEDKLLSGESGQMLDEIHDAADRASNLTRQLLAFSRRQIMKLTTLDPGDLVRNLTHMLERLMGEDIAIDFDVPTELPSIKADTGMIEQAVINLVLNARDAMPEGGQVTIRAQSLKLSKSEAEQKPDAMPGRHVRISVSDSGTGIEPEQLPHIFDPFFTTKEVGKGTGLGLATVFGIAKQHDGWVEVETAVGSGTTFHLYLPSVLEETQSQPEEENSTRANHGSETILIVEDEDGVRKTMRNVLRRAGYRVMDAADGPEALNSWAGHEHDIDLLVTDMRMPGGMSGRDLANRIRETRPDLLAVYCTGYSAELTGLTTLNERERLLPKPFENKMLIKVVREILDENRVAADA